MKRILFALSCATLAACNCGGVQEPAHRVVIQVDQALKADCLELKVSAGGPALATQLFPRESGSGRYVIGVLRQDLPATVTYSVAGYLGSSCSTRSTLKLNTESAAVEATFPASGTEEVRVPVGPPNTTLDVDRDGYVDVAQGGLDCDDANINVKPEGTQVCGSALDTDCDGRVACADDDCLSDATCARPASKLVFTNMERTVTAFDCSEELVVQSQDFAGVAPVSVDTRVALTSSLAGVTFHLDTACTDAPVAEATLLYQQSDLRLRVKGAMAGLATLTADATSAGLNPGTQALTITAPTVASLAFTTPPRTVQAGACSADVITLETRDSRGQPTPTAAALDVSLTLTPSAGGDVFAEADTTCATPLSPAVLQVPMGASTISFRVRATNALAATLTAQAAPLSPITQGLTVNAGPPSTIAFSSLASAQVNGCSVVPTRVELFDAFGNPAAAQAAEVALLDTTAAPGGGTLSFFDAAGCAGAAVAMVTIPQGATGADVWVRGDVVGAYTMRARWGTASATEVASIVSGPPDRLAITTTGFAARAGECSPQAVRFETRDSSGAASPVTASTAVTIASTHAVLLFSDGACTTPLAGGNTVTLGTGQATGVFSFRGTVANPSFSFSATATGLTAGTGPGFSLTAASPNRLRWNPVTTSLSAAAGACSSALTLDVLDAFDNPATFGVATVLTLASAPAGLQFSSASDCSAPGASVTIGAAATTAVFYARGTTVGTSAISGSAAGRGTSTPDAQLQVTPGSPSLLTYLPTPPATAAAGACTSFTALRRDAFGNDTAVPSDTAVFLTATGAASGGVTFYANVGDCSGAANAVAQVTMASGTATSTFFARGTAAGATSIVATQTGLTPASHALAVSPGAATRLDFTPTPPASVAAGDCTAATVTRRDAFGNDAAVASNTAVSLAAAGAAGPGVTFYANAGDCAVATNAVASVTMSAGTATASFLFRGTTAGAAGLNITQAGVPTGATHPFTVTFGATAALAFLGAGGSVASGACSAALTVERRDLFGNPAAPASALTVNLSSTASGALSFAAGAGCLGGAVVSIDIASGASQGTLSFNAAVAEPVTLTGSAGGVPTNATQGWTVTPGAPAQLAWKTAPPAVQAPNGCSALTVETRDAAGNVAPVAAAVTLNPGSSGAATNTVFYAATDCTGGTTTTVTLPMSQSEVSFGMRPQAGGTTTITASDAAVVLTPTPGVVVTVQSDRLVLSTAATTLETGKCQAATVERQTGAGLPLTSGALVVTLASNLVTNAALFSDATCTTPAPSVTIADASSQATFSVKALTAAATGTAVTVTATAGGFTDGTLNLTVLPMVRRGTCTIANGAFSNTCALTPPIPGDAIGRTFLVFQATNTTDAPTSAPVGCRLISSPQASVSCARAGITTETVVTWETVSFAEDFAGGGVSVQHLTGNHLFTDASPTSVAISSVDLSQSFVLFSYGVTTGTEVDGNDFLTARLTSATALELGGQTTPFNSSKQWFAQVVSYAGATVVRGDLTPGSSSATYTANPTSGVVAQSFLLYSAVTSDTTSDYLCKRRFRGTITDATTLTFRRGSGGGAGGGNCTNDNLTRLTWERVTLPTGGAVQSSLETLGNGSGTTTRTLTSPVDPSRSIVFAGGQGYGGQTGGESNFDNNPRDRPGAMNANLVLATDGAGYTLTRPVTNDTSVWQPFVVTFAP